MEVTVKDVCCITANNEEICTGVLDLTVNQAVQLVKDLSIEMESVEFDELCYQFFKTVVGE